MSDCFNGAALYTKEEIGKALTTYENEIKQREEFIAKKVKEAEEKFTPNWKDKLFKVKTLHDKYWRWYTGGFRWYTYQQWLNIRGYLLITDEEGKWLQKLSHYKYDSVYFDVFYHTETNCDVKALYNGGKDCYLSPKQAYFISKFKNYEV